MLLGLALPLAKAAEVERPNFIIIFCDDLGYADIGPFGSENHRTPNLDRMAAEGRKFTSFYVTSDIGETTDVLADHAGVAKRLAKLAMGMRADLGDDLTGAKGSGTREPGFVKNAKTLTKRK